MAGTIMRKSYTAHRKSKIIRVKASSKHKAYTRKLSKKTIYVKASPIKDLGKPGKGPKLFSVKKGGLTKYGYSSKDAESTRRNALARAIKAEGPNVVEKRLNAIATYNKNKSPKLYRIFKGDANWVHNKYFA
jgi:hypothetical protein